MTVKEQNNMVAKQALTWLASRVQDDINTILETGQSPLPAARVTADAFLAHMKNILRECEQEYVIEECAKLMANTMWGSMFEKLVLVIVAGQDPIAYVNDILTKLENES